MKEICDATRFCDSVYYLPLHSVTVEEGGLQGDILGWLYSSAEVNLANSEGGLPSLIHRGFALIFYSGLYTMTWVIWARLTSCIDIFLESLSQPYLNCSL